MCAIIGALFKKLDNPAKMAEADRILSHIWRHSHSRGRDGRGYRLQRDGLITKEYRSLKRGCDDIGISVEKEPFYCGLIIGNLRAEPTTEFVLGKEFSDQQPYSYKEWSIVHNGTIANDKALRTHELETSIDSSAIVEQLCTYPRNIRSFDVFLNTVKKLKGSYAILACNNMSDTMYVAANYRPVWYAETDEGVFFASSRSYFPRDLTPQMIAPYTATCFARESSAVISQRIVNLLPESNNRALVVCSGGLDSVVAATYAKHVMGMDVGLIHFLYGSRAEGPEVQAVKAVAEALGVTCKLFPLAIYSKSDSPLLDPDSKVAGGEAGAEFAHEWVPARNLLLLSVATAYAEANGYDALVLGNNLEEAGAYPDNEPEFIDKFNDLLPFAVGDGKQLKVLMPVGNMMKHEIVRLGFDIGAPMHLTWSCYRAGEQHCGTCGPCYMRRKAFEMNSLEEVINYKEQQ